MQAHSFSLLGYTKVKAGEIMERIILHCDLNNFYASVECMKNPSLRQVPVAVAGNSELRHGIILAKNQLAKEKGVITGQAIWEAQQMCSDLVVLPPDFHEYLRYSKMVKEIFSDYTDRIEDYGIDESWLDVTESKTLFGDGEAIAKTIQKRVYQEVGLTCSIGVSFNKIFAKLGSDYKKPMGLTIITKQNYPAIVWPLPVDHLLYVGRATLEKLHYMGIHTIGDLAKSKYGQLQQALGKWGEYLWLFANGKDESSVATSDYRFPIKSIGNGITPPKDIYTIDEFRLIAYVLCESIVQRMREQNVVARCIKIQLRTKNLHTYTRQNTFFQPIYTVNALVTAVVTLCQTHYDFKIPLRSITISVSQLSLRDAPMQLSLFDEEDVKEEEHLDVVMAQIRKRFGNFSVRRCSMKLDLELTMFDPLADHTIHPYTFFR